ncbi:integral membrane protein [Histoplasma capsulatum var. duboisii H88]|uniref:Integral membrane protein n=1 Tax=Ajellomyces capsulatus (strain H88) TaxID=544711 RepID=A0A8A1LLX0_AJEC8|nr:integral membrane protein [Histoplasma capsulatum var. duboisii H88]
MLASPKFYSSYSYIYISVSCLLGLPSLPLFHRRQE